MTDLSKQLENIVDTFKAKGEGQSEVEGQNEIEESLNKDFPILIQQQHNYFIVWCNPGTGSLFFLEGEDYFRG